MIVRGPHHGTTRPGRRLSGAAAAMLLAGALGVPTSGARAAEAAGAVVQLTGSAAAFARAERRVLSPQAAVFLDDTVTTAESSKLEIRLGGETTLKMGAKGRVRIDRLTGGGGLVSLEDGAALVDKSPESKALPLEIESSFGRIVVRGTRFFVGPNRGAFAVLVLRGKVSVEAGGASVDLTDGEGTDIARPGARPSPVTTWSAARVAEALAEVE